MQKIEELKIESLIRSAFSLSFFEHMLRYRNYATQLNFFSRSKSGIGLILDSSLVVLLFRVYFYFVESCLTFFASTGSVDGNSLFFRFLQNCKWWCDMVERRSDFIAGLTYYTCLASNALANFIEPCQVAFFIRFELFWIFASNWF
jgi:hypothetical protein